MDIRTKLKILSLGTVIGLGIVLTITIVGLDAMQDAEDAAHRGADYIADLIEIKASALSSIMLDPTLQETKDVFFAAEKNIAEHGGAATKLFRQSEINENLQRILELWNQYDLQSQKLIKLAATNPKSANDGLVPLYNQQFKPFQADLEKLIASRQADAAQSRVKAKTVSTRTFWGIISILVLVTAVTVAMVFRLTLSLQVTLKGIKQQLIPLRQGDLTQRLPVTAADELGDIAIGVNSFVEELQAIVQRTRDRSSQLANAAQLLASASASVLHSASQQSDATSTVAASVEQFSVSIDQVSENATDAEQKATLSGNISQRSDTEVSNAVGEIRHIEQVVGEATQQMEALGQQAREISGIVNVIKEVADQTNLLALNAAIEAARAGETGRGFAVVADEVRKLAERTASSAQEITGMVTAIQSNTEKATGMMQQGNELVAQGVRQVEKAGSSMRQINDSSAGVLRAISDISSALREQRIAGTEIAKNVARIAGMTEAGRNAATDVSSASEALGTLAAELQSEVAKFKT